MRFRRSLLLVMALIVGGGLGAVLLPKFEPVKIILFFAICSVLGEVFYRIDQRISKTCSLSVGMRAADLSFGR